jgi:glycosyltransferase involved in cell wall biosynthesis
LKSFHRPADILCFGTDWYLPLHSSVKQVVLTWHSRGSRVLWVNPIPVRFPRAKGRQFWKKVKSKARTHSRLLSKQGDRLHVYSPVYLPIFNRWGWLLNQLLLSGQILLLRLLLGMRRPLVVGSEYSCWFARHSLGRLPLFFHFADKISAFREVAQDPDRRRILEDMERDLIKRASVAGCSSRVIYEHVLAQAGSDSAKILYLPHCADLDAFQGDAAGSTDSPADIADVPRPIAGYFGSLTQTNDQEAFLAAARALPDFSFVFIGQVAGDYSRLEAEPNVFFLGPKPHDLIPRYGRQFAICFMGWLPHEWIASCSPLKTIEYLALGKPVVCTGHIAELATDFPELVRFVDSGEALAAALAEELANDSPERAAARKAAVADRTWSNYVDQVARGFSQQGVVVHE